MPGFKGFMSVSQGIASNLLCKADMLQAIARDPIAGGKLRGVTRDSLQISNAKSSQDVAIFALRAIEFLLKTKPYAFRRDFPTWDRFKALAIHAIESGNLKAIDLARSEPQVFCLSGDLIKAFGLTDIESRFNSYADILNSLSGSFLFCLPAETAIGKSRVNWIFVQRETGDNELFSTFVMAESPTSGDIPSRQELEEKYGGQVVAIAIQALLMIASGLAEPPLDPKGERNYVFPPLGKQQRRRKDFRFPCWLGREFKLRSEAGEGKKSAHWRRGHYRNQPIGAGRTGRKLIWVQPTMIGCEKAS